MTGWREGLGPWTPVLRGRQALRPRRRRRRLRDLRLAHRDHARCRRRACAHARCVVLIEACEESGSYDLPAYIDALCAARIGSRRWWLPRFRLRQLRPAVADHLAARPRGGTLRVEVLAEGVHSGDATGIVPSSFRILRAAARPDRGRRHRPDAPGRLHVADSRRAPRAGARRPPAARRRGRATSSRSPASTQPMADDLCRAGAQPHLAAGAGGDRRRRPAADRAAPATCCARRPR